VLDINIFDSSLARLAEFQQLAELILADASTLKVDFYPPTCGNIDMGAKDDAVRT
jgi:hypothetical protein